VQILVVCRPVSDNDQSEFRRTVPAESAALRELKERGILANAWTPGRPGAVLISQATPSPARSRAKASTEQQNARPAGAGCLAP
jgi:hypothetical protein